MDKLDGISQKLETVFEQAKNDMAKIVGGNNTPINTQTLEEIENGLDELSCMDEQIEESKEIVETKQNNIVINDVTDVGIQNQQYLESKIKNRIETTEKMLTNFEALIELNKDNANMIPRMYEVYANLTNSISLLLREMRELSKMRIGIDLVIADNVIKSKKGEEEVKPVNQGITLTSGELLKLIKEAQNSGKSEINDAEFVVMEEPK